VPNNNAVFHKSCTLRQLYLLPEWACLRVYDDFKPINLEDHTRRLRRLHHRLFQRRRQLPSRQCHFWCKYLQLQNTVYWRSLCHKGLLNAIQDLFSKLSNWTRSGADSSVHNHNSWSLWNDSALIYRACTLRKQDILLERPILRIYGAARNDCLQINSLRLRSLHNRLLQRRRQLLSRQCHLWCECFQLQGEIQRESPCCRGLRNKIQDFFQELFKWTNSGTNSTFQDYNWSLQINNARFYRTSALQDNDILLVRPINRIYDATWNNCLHRYNFRLRSLLNWLL